jgi:hypothetical protein
MKLLLLFFIVIICISSNFKFVDSAPGEMIFKIVVPDNIDVDSFNVGGKVKNNDGGAAAPPTTVAATTATTAGKVAETTNMKTPLQKTEEEEE